MNQILYIPYREAHNIPSDELIVVDSHYPRGLVLGHVYEERMPVELHGNTSTDAVFNWLRLPEAEKHRYVANPRYVTCNHFDIDGFLALWSILSPDFAEGYSRIIQPAAHLGDFREFDPSTPHGLAALKLCCILNHLEATQFCLPFGDLDDASIEHEVAEQKFAYFLPRLLGWLEVGLDHYEEFWREEYDEVMADVAFIQAGGATIEEVPDGDLSIIRTPRPLHYYASFSAVKAGAVLTHLTSINYFEFEYRYETRVGRIDKTVYPRRDLTALAEELTRLEDSPTIRWTFDNINEGGPMLRPEHVNRPPSREDRYQSLGFRLEKNLCPKSGLEFKVVEQLLREALSR